MAVNNFCEVCEEAGLTSKMVPFQINMDEALLICEDTKCVFPLGTPHVSTFIISRTANEMSNCKRKRKNVGIIAVETKKSVNQKCEKVIHWQNADALCWLDSALSLLVHNTTIKQLLSKIQTCENSLLKYLDGQYSKAQFLSEFDLSNATKVLQDIRGLVWTYLCPKMKCTLGVNDSPLFALPLLLRENAVTADNCLQEYTCEFSCQSCGHIERTRHKKYIVTFPNTPKNFNIQECSFQRPCSKCRSKDQYSTIVYERVPDVVLLHFVEGLKSTDYLKYQFIHQNSSYCLTQFIQYVQHPDHFVCWTKQDNGSRWLELDDLKPPLCSWSSLPNVSPSEVYIIVLQKVASNNNVSLEQGPDSCPHCKDTPQTVVRNHDDVSLDEGPESHSNFKDTPQKDIEINRHLSTECTADVELTQVTLQDITSELYSKLKVTASDHGTPVDSNTKSLPSSNVVENTRSVSTPTVIKDRKPLCPKTPSHLSPSGGSLFRVALKRLSSVSTFQPLLPKRRRTLVTQFQPYVPKKERHQVENTEITTENVSSPTDYDSGYSSPSSVSSCGSSSNMRSKDETNDIADQLEKLLPDCLVNATSVDECAALKQISIEQDDYINKLLYSD